MDTIRNISAVLGMIATAYAIYAIFRKKMRVQAKAKVSVFKPLPNAAKDSTDFMEAISELRRAFRIASQDDIVDISILKADDCPANYREAVKKLVSAVPRSLFRGSYSPGLIFELKSCVEIDIVNRGTMEAKDLILHCDFKGVGQIEREGVKPEALSFDQQIPLGALRTRAKLKVTLWTSDSLISWSDDAYISHSEGSVPIREGVVVYGKAAKALDWIQDEVPMWLLLIWLLCIIGPVCLTILKANSPPTTQPTTHPTTNP